MTHYQRIWFVIYINWTNGYFQTIVYLIINQFIFKFRMVTIWIQIQAHVLASCEWIICSMTFILVIIWIIFRIDSKSNNSWNSLTFFFFIFLCNVSLHAIGNKTNVLNYFDKIMIKKYFPGVNLILEIDISTQHKHKWYFFCFQCF